LPLIASVTAQLQKGGKKRKKKKESDANGQISEQKSRQQSGLYFILFSSQLISSRIKINGSHFFPLANNCNRHLDYSPFVYVYNLLLYMLTI